MTSREGLALIGRTFFDSQANWYLMLGTGSLPAGTGTLADWAALESTGTGYTRQAIAGTSVAVSYDGTDTIYTCPQVTWTGGANGWGALTELERHYLDTYGDPAPSFLDVVLNQKTLKATLNQTSLQATLNQETLSAVLNRET